MMIVNGLATATNPLIPVMVAIVLLIVIVRSLLIASDHVALYPPKFLDLASRRMLRANIPTVNFIVLAALTLSFVLSTAAIIGIIGALI